jgi:hypothetical protein
MLGKNEGVPECKQGSNNILDTAPGSFFGVSSHNPLTKH